MKSREITNPGFIKEFLRRHEVMTDRPFCWVLGSGASVQSGIPSGGKLAYQWLAEMHEMEHEGNLPVEKWATAENLGITGLEYAKAANSYPWIYQRRFRDYKEQGYAFLETIMDKAEPSFGYSVLAQIMATTRHNVAVTTNFDNLVADALSIYARTFPLVCGHESLTGYIRPNLRRPLIAKIHRDLLLAPFNNPDEISKLPGEWTAALTKIFSRFTPIVIGYGGNDGSLMNFLKTLDPIEGGIFWCYRQGVEPVVNEVIERHKGKLVPIAGFDELMLQLSEALKLESPLPQLQTVHEQRRSDYQRQFEALTEVLRKPAETPAAEEARKPVRVAAEAVVQRLTKEKDWWGWQLKANAESDPVKRESIYREGLAEFPESGELTGNFALFRERVKDYEEAERLYRKAMAMKPTANRARNFAIFMEQVRGDFDEAERLYRLAVDLAPHTADWLCSLGVFMHTIRRKPEEAESLYREALVYEPDHAHAIGNIANLMKSVHRDNGQAEKLYRRAIELSPDVPRIRSNFANFLTGIGAHDEAEQNYRRAVELDAKDPSVACNYAQFLATFGRDIEARKMAENGWAFAQKRPAIMLAEIAFTWYLLNRAGAIDASQPLGWLKTLLGLGFIRASWSFDALLVATLPRLPENEQPLAKKLAAGILDEAAVAALDDEPLWRAAAPIPLDTPWPPAEG
jgi:Flp pilus assembly protein TadD